MRVQGGHGDARLREAPLRQGVVYEVQLAEHLRCGDKFHCLGEGFMSRKVYHPQTRRHQHGGGLAYARQTSEDFLMTNIVHITGGVNGFFVDGRRHHGGQLATETALGCPLHRLHGKFTTSRLHLTKAEVFGLWDAKVEQIPAGYGFIRGSDVM